MAGSNGQSDVLWRAASVVLPILAAIFSWFLSADRFTGADGEVLQVQVDANRRDIENLPPGWLTDDIARLEKENERLRERIDKLEERYRGIMIERQPK